MRLYNKNRFTRLIGCAILLVMLAFIMWQRAVVVEATNQPNQNNQTNHFIRINEIMAGANGDSSIQFIEMEMLAGQNLWGPQSGETIGRAMLTFSDAAGNQTGRFVFSSDPADPGNDGGNLLIATQAFADLSGAPTPDVIIPEEIMAISGKVCFKENPDTDSTAHFHVTLCVSYGNFAGSTEGAGSPVADGLPILGTSSLRRFQNNGQFDFGEQTNNNADFQLSTTPNPTNSAGESFTFSHATEIEQGKILFLQETFNGNGRTCGSCHMPQDDFGLTAETIHCNSYFRCQRDIECTFLFEVL